MITIKDEYKCPPGGWNFFESATGWTNSGTSVWDLNLLCQEIQAHRRANPRFALNTDLNAIKIEAKQQNALRLLSMPNTESYLKEDSAPAMVSPKTLRPLRKLAAVAGAGSRLISGAGVIMDWLGSGGVPVAKELAEKRAAVCVACPMNQDGDWFTDKASELIRSQVGAKNDLSLTTSVDDKLKTCVACKCPMVLKIWTPLAHIKAHLKDEVRKELHPSCWIPIEV